MDRHLTGPGGDDVVFYVNQDIGGGATYGLYLQENEAWKPLLDTWVAFLAPAVARRNVWVRIGSSDHISFERAGVPAFSTIQDYTDYDVRTHHTNADDYERVTEEDLRKSAAFLAGLLWQATMHEGALPGWGRRREERQPMKKIADTLFMIVGGDAGWFAGALFGVFTAFIPSMLGAGAGLYVSSRLASRYVP